MEFAFDIWDLIAVKKCPPRVVNFDYLVSRPFRNWESVDDERAAGAHFIDSLLP